MEISSEKADVVTQEDREGRTLGTEDGNRWKHDLLDLHFSLGSSDHLFLSYCS